MPRGSFHFKNCKAFLTYARCTVSKEEILTFLSTLGKLSEYVIGLEAHADGTPHLHCVLRYSPRVETRSARYFDYNGFHPNLEIPGTKADLHRVARYASKDGDFIQKGTLLKISRTELYSKILEQQSITSAFISAHPDILGLNFTSIHSWLRLYNSQRDPYVVKTLPKQRHLWVHGGSNTGKTTWLRGYLVRYTASAGIPPNDDWSHVTTSNDCLYCDEYRGHLTIQKLNSLCDGLIILNTKGGSTNLGQPTLIIVSNFSIAECYPNSSILDTLYNRFVEVYVPNDKFPL